MLLGVPEAESRPLPNRTPQRMPFETPEFSMVDRPLAVATDHSKATPWLSGSTIAALDQGALVVDEDTGVLVRTGRDGERIASVRMGAGVGQLVYHAPTKRAYVADRSNDQIAVVDVSAGLRVIHRIPTPAEPFGVALTASGKTLAVTTVASRRLVGYDTKSFRRRWGAELGPEPRGVAFSPDAGEAIVTMLSSGAVAKVEFEAGRPPQVFYASITPRDATPAGGRGKAFVRNAFAAAYLNDNVAVVPHQLSRPVSGEGRENPGRYGGGGSLPPVEHRLAFVERGPTISGVASARAQLHQPRAVAYDAHEDRLFVAGLGSDEVLAIENASSSSVKGTWQRTLSDGGEACGPSGLAIAPNGDLLANCSFSRRIVRLTKNAHEVAGQTSSPGFDIGPEVARSRLSAAAQRGKVIFHRGEDSRVSSGGMLACASCHAEGRADGLSWQIQGATLQTPLLAGRLRGTHPYKWDGQDPNIESSLRNTVMRLGGRGITEAEAADLRAYLDALPRARPPKRARTRIARGKKLFDGKSGCASCHNGPRLTDRKAYNLAKDLPKVDTPSLIGLAASAPYYHDGSAQTLRSALMENGTVHDMGVTVGLTSPELDDLVAYLETL
ncbi:MAG: c-type cytochrome [Myxococcota bacterium]